MSATQQWGWAKTCGRRMAAGAPLFLLGLSPAMAMQDFLQDGRAGFVVSHFSYALAPDAEISGACPDGMSRNVQEIYQMTPAGKRRTGETDKDYKERLEAAVPFIPFREDGANACMNPEKFGPDPHFRTVKSAGPKVDGIDLDGRDSQPDGASGAKCAHGDFKGLKGGAGIDNQFYRLVGCSRSWQTTGPSNTFDVEMFSGSWGILITLEGVDDLENDDEVEVGFYANADPMQLSPRRDALAYATYAMDQDPAYRATAKGRIKDGVLTNVPVDIQFHSVTNSMVLVRPLKDARLEVTISGDGTLDGYLGGYVPVEELYDYQYGFRTGKTKDGEDAPPRLRLISSNGAARVLGHTCNGAYYAMKALADGHPDPETGQCTSLSTQYRLTAVPAFVVDVETRSQNDALKQAEIRRPTSSEE